MTRWREGDAARVVDLTDLKMPGKGRPPFAKDDIVRVRRVSPDGKRLVLDTHPGWFSAHRFKPL
ncbi:hypothetical protein CA606_18360 [Caulobacter vibrioides]|uniref:Uncharacterized protein n=1 Tax=Caulobacter vibrioides TaxID=155892 RepID=A0A290MPW8_CAUVI|nr:hypothetical protein [Caulobacter vibrioides]ATC34137.1 hypothetical protein CA606_18360 [Caulobacter vibrioides]